MVNWNTFESLPGSVTYNFEVLSRSLVWLSYSRYGTFRAQLNQPGVEFDLQLHTDCVLGNTGQHFGWQCRWYGIASGVNIGATRKKKIIDAIDKSIADIPGLTDWVLWTRHTLTKADQNWFYALRSDIKLHLWTTFEAETLLDTDGELLKKSYFGDLILTPDQLSNQHNLSVAPIKKRWFPEVHQVLDAEREIRQMLGSSKEWDELILLSQEIMELYSEMRHRMETVPNPLLAQTEQFLNSMDFFASQLKTTFDLLASGEFGLLKQTLSDELSQQLQQISSLPRKLRGARLQIGVIVTNAFADLKKAEYLLSKVSRFLNTRLVGIVADAGSGKTQLSATLTAPQENKPAGLLLLGRFLHHTSSLDDLARSVVINGKPVESMQGLLAALNAAAERAKCILPLVIDGLNEAEDPRQWKNLLSSLNAALDQYPAVLVICTLRSGARKEMGRHDLSYYDDEQEKLYPFVQSCLPDCTTIFEIPDFGDDVGDAMERYFSFFNIDANAEPAYINMLRHPLTLRIFCEVTNPKREKNVGMEAVPRSLAALFERYIELAAERIEELSPFHRHYQQADIAGYLDRFGEWLWVSQSRGINERQFRTDIRDDQALWSSSAVNYMEQEGLLLRMPGEITEQDEIVPTYDLLGGYLIAKHIISRQGRDTITQWFKDIQTAKALSNNYADQHPLRDDIIRFLAALLPQYHHVQLWQVVGGSLRDEALEMAILLEQKYLDSATIETVATDIKTSRPSASRYFRWLVDIHDTAKHPFNALFIDRTFREMKPGKRDLLWTEWLRRNENFIQQDVDDMISMWSNNLESRTPVDALRARWLMWMLTTSIHKLRYKVTLALYWYGRGDINQLFDLTSESIAINDPYVPERMLASSYGAAMALATESNDTEFCNRVLREFARRIYDLIYGTTAEYRLSHLLILDYARGIIELAQYHAPSCFTNEELANISCSRKPVKTSKGKRNVIRQPEHRESPFRMDFENYTIGSLVPGRHNYDSEHTEYKKVKSRILERIFELGWSFKSFGNVDKTIENSRFSHSRYDGDDIKKIDRYGKKYSWIAYYEQKGLIDQPNNEENEIYFDRRESDADIDPSFPQRLCTDPIINFDVLGSEEITVNEWIKNGVIPDLSIYLQQQTLEDETGPWVLLDGTISQQDENRGRGMFAFFRAFFVATDEVNELVSLLKKQRLGGRWLPEKAEIGGTFAGEIPWSRNFPEMDDQVLKFVVGETNVDVEEVEDRFYLDGIEVDLTHFDKLRVLGINFPSHFVDDDQRLSDEEFNKLEIRQEKIIVKRVEQKFCCISVIQPVCDLRLVGKTLSNEYTGRSTLNKKLIQILDLTAIPRSRNLQTSSGMRATFQNSNQKSSFKNSESLFYLKKELLDSLLEQLNMSLIWAVWGERELSLGQFELRERKNFGNSIAYADFQQIHIYGADSRKSD